MTETQNIKFEVEEGAGSHIVLKYGGHELHVMHWGLNAKTGHFEVELYEAGNDSETPNESTTLKIKGA